MDETTKRTMFQTAPAEPGSRTAEVPVNPLPKGPGVEGEPDLIAEAAGAHPSSGAAAATGGDGEGASPTEMTYATRLPPDHPGLQLEKPQARTLRRGPILVIAGLLTTAVLIAAAVALSSPQ